MERRLQIGITQCLAHQLTALGALTTYVVSRPERYLCVAGFVHCTGRRDDLSITAECSQYSGLRLQVSETQLQTTLHPRDTSSSHLIFYNPYGKQAILYEYRSRRFSCSNTDLRHWVHWLVCPTPGSDNDVYRT